MATSGTVGAVAYPIRKVMDSGFRRAGYDTQKISGEGLTIALDLLYTLCADLAGNAGMPLWTRQSLLLSIAKGSADVRCPTGTIDIIHSFWRSLMPWRGAAVLSTGGSNSTLFTAADASDVTIGGPDAGAGANFGAESTLNTIGVLLGGSVDVTSSLQVQTSTDGVTWTLNQSLPSTTFAPQVWAYFDLDPIVISQYVRIVNAGVGNLTLNHLNFGFAGGIDTPLGVENIDDYFLLPNRMQQADRPVVVYVDRHVDVPVLKLWQVPNSAAFYAGTVTALARRYMQDPGTLANDLEVPPRWLEAIQWELGHKIISEIPPEIVTGEQVELTALRLQERKDRRELCERMSDKHKMKAWAEERTKAPIRLTPNITPYTA